MSDTTEHLEKSKALTDKVPNEQTKLVAAEKDTVLTPLAKPSASPSPARKRISAKTGVLIGVIILGAAAAAYWIVPKVRTAIETVSTNDAYVNGHATFVAPRVSGQVARVLVDDNQRVMKGDVLVELDKEPYQLQVSITQAKLDAAKSDLGVAEAQVRAAVAQVRSSRFNLDHAMESVRNQVALLRSNVAELQVEQANLELAEREYARNKPLVDSGAVSQQEFEEYLAKRDVARSRVTNARETIQQTRASLGLPINYEKPLDMPEDLDQNFSLVRQALQQLAQSAAAIGYFPKSWNASPKESLAEFFKLDPQGDLDKIYAKLITDAPAIQQAHARVKQAERDLAQAELDLRYCDVVSEIDGVVTRRNVNPGNNVQVGESLMVVRSVTEIWIDANFKETQLAKLRIGQRVDCEVDMYGRRQRYEGRITGFTMGTGQTLSLLPPQNATGNFVKIVQRLPVKIELTKYDPEKAPLFVGLSVTPYVYFKEPPTGKDAGAVLQSLQTQ